MKNDTTDTKSNFNNFITSPIASKNKAEFFKFREEIYRLYEDRVMQWLNERPRRMKQEFIDQSEEREAIGNGFEI
jgi:hypothetical protein